MTTLPAGRDWVAFYPTSRSLADLAEPFRSSARAFIAELAVIGCGIRLSATRRPVERAYLMHWAWLIAREGAQPPPARPGIAIAWTFPGAEEMVDAYGIVVRPSLTSRHITGNAVDMTISGWPTDAAAMERLYALGASFGVHKLRSDVPHWSDDGR